MIRMVRHAVELQGGSLSVAEDCTFLHVENKDGTVFLYMLENTSKARINKQYQFAKLSWELKPPYALCIGVIHHNNIPYAMFM